jgi:hypothetical protein
MRNVKLNLFRNAKSVLSSLSFNSVKLSTSIKKNEHIFFSLEINLISPR